MLAEPRGFPQAESAPLYALLGNGTLDSRIAALFWLAAEHAASIMVTALPRLAGKTTTLNTFLRFTAPDTTFRVIQGDHDPFEFVHEPPSPKRYLIANEFSPAPVPTYLWGPKVPLFLEAGRAGHPLAVTMHADAFDEVASLLAQTGVAERHLAALDLYVLVRVVPSRAGPIRRVVEVRQLLSEDDGPLRTDMLVEWQPDSDTFRHHEPESLLKGIIPPPSWRLDEVKAELARRAAVLAGAADQGALQREGLRAVLEAYRRDADAAAALYRS
ncbi:MAG TPA: hypothetical protein VI789_02190 [Dehalococcoidia bacterium]|nr:hypothetical protein [Dehalococcoidia bacterium]